MSKINIHKATIEDAKAIAELAYETYWDTFHAHPDNDPKDFADYMKKAFSLKQIQNELGDKNAIFLIARKKDEELGYAKLELFKTEPPIERKKPIEINRIYAKKEFLGKGVGQKLMDACIKTAKELNCDVIWLGVWEKNPRAIRFYEKNGFHEIGSHTFQMGSDRQTDWLMQKVL